MKSALNKKFWALAQFILMLRQVSFFVEGIRLEHVTFEIVHTGKMLLSCEAKRSKAREIGVGELCPPLSDNLKRKRP